MNSEENPIQSEDSDDLLRTPDYRKNCKRVQIAPIELFADNKSKPKENNLIFPTESGSTTAVTGNGHGIINVDNCNDCKKLKQQYDLLYKEQLEVQKMLSNIKQENELKSMECHEAWTSLHELRNELMRKSMHVGSLACAVEGQVREMSNWFQALDDISQKLKLLKREHASLSEEVLEYKKCLDDMSQVASTLQSTVDQHFDVQRELNNLKHLYAKVTKERKELYNKVMELKGNIKVFCRCRPLNPEEIEAGKPMAIDFETAKDGDLTVKSSHGSFKKVFKFDSVFSPEDNQETIFEKTSPLILSVLDGYNVCIFAYGQTGTGKTFTMEGTEEARGVNYRTLEELFRVIKERNGVFKYELSVSVLEVYNEQIRDLLLPDSQAGMPAKRLEVRQVADGEHHVTGLVEANVSNMSEVWEVLQTGSKSRAVGATNSNEHSSRSHCIYCVTVRGENLVDGECTRSKLWLVDLSGSERVAKTDAQGDRLKEAQSINKSLAALGDVISALATKSQHIPYRNSKLTHLLQDSLGGDSKTLMFVQISPNENDVGETLCSLNFASRVRGIELGPAKKQVDGYKQLVEKIRQDNKNKECQIKKLEETVQSLEDKNKAKDLSNKNLQEKIKELESQLRIERKLVRQHIGTKVAEQQQEEKQKVMQQETPLPTSISKPSTIAKEITTNTVLPLTENNSFMTKNNNCLFKNFTNTVKDKENNNPDLLEDPASTRRYSLAPFSHSNKILLDTSASRRCSLIPMPVIGIIKETETVKPENMNIIVEETIENLNSSAKRSAGKKTAVRTPLPQTVKRRTAARLENVRVSIGGSARTLKKMTKREDKVQKSRMDKERGWNQRTVSRNAF